MGSGEWVSVEPACGYGWVEWGVFVFLSFVFFFLVSFSFSSGIVRATQPYRMVNTGLCDYKKIKK